MPGDTSPPPNRPPTSPTSPARTAGRNPDSSPWLWLLVIPVVLPLLPMLYNSVDPQLLGIPFFYWFQLAMVFVSAGLTAVVYVKTRRR